MFDMWDVQDVGCSDLVRGMLGCGMSWMWNVSDVECSESGMLANLRDIYKMYKLPSTTTLMINASYEKISSGNMKKVNKTYSF